MNPSNSLDNAWLQQQLIKLGDMMGDGLHHEPGGKWIAQEYRKTAKALGLLAPAKRQRRIDPEEVNRRMAERCAQVTCGKCDGQLKQVRSGSMRARCDGCGVKFQLLKTQRKS
ncbi:hypothetical protein ACJJIU_22180 (plasmid) [Microbulbifer sp. CnH-101-E]|uniref:hypothetical protein n=1 Tax=unclassified Microbulbifer TaxID=2619833 RepID=UPI004039A0FE